MSNFTELYVRGMSQSETEDDAVEENIWDDRKLNDAYDKALKIANAEVAKRLAMSTNTQQLAKSSLEKDQTKIKKETSSKPNSVKGPQMKVIKWKAGMPCRAIYEGDGQEYEANILRLINDTECVVRFLGYENSEIVTIGTLKQSMGKEARMRQMKESPLDNMECSDIGTSPGSIGSSQKKKKSQKKRNQRVMNNLPEMPMPMLNPLMLGNLSSMDMPLPPPPPLGFSSELSDTEDQAISSMLLSWYMSGYYTGLYQGMKRSKENRRNAIN